jgi:hypothetical protein
VPRAEQILNPTGTGARLDLGYTDECIPVVPRFVKTMVFGGSEAILSS